MNTLFVLFWTAMIFGSIAWYGFLAFYVGYKGGREIRAMTRTLKQRNEEGQAMPAQNQGEHDN